MALQLIATIHGVTVDDLDLALDQIKEKIIAGFTSGFDSSDSGRYSFTVSGQEGPDSEEVDL